MAIDTARFSKLLGDFKLEALFNELGWEHPTLKPQAIVVNGESFALTQVAHKRGVAVLRCSADSQGNIPCRGTLLKIDREAAKIAHEHLLVFSDTAQTMLTWLWVARAPGQPTSTRTHTWHKGQSSEALRQKLNQIVWSLEEEEAVTLNTVITGLKRAFDRDRVSRSFYDSFKAQHDAFADFIKGLADVSDRAWYASLMLNRLMFVYFIQKKGFLDGNETYLTDRLTRVCAEAGKGKFHSFYRQFLRRLFHEGLGQAKAARTPDLAHLIGEVPYLNGGLFDVHELESRHPDIDVPDEAFERLFAFFDAWDWHLDDRPLKKGNEINPDVLGYIFEKYINQKQMGAYYTKEDITEYISKNTVIPHLLERTRERCKVAFDGVASVWNLLKADPQRYIYPAMKTGVLDASGNVVPESALPDFVQTGMADPQARMFERRYNLGEALFCTATDERGTLPTETWREYVERRTRCLSLLDKLSNGSVKSTDDLITLNLDIRQFMQDVIDTATSPDLLRAVWQAIVGRVPERSTDKFLHGITILDPTCGSGAFLFAALNVLEPLYEGCLDRMDGFVEDAKKLGRAADADFVKTLAEVARHPSRRYYVYKSIILHNLFGVDIMAEAVEICKLRLFLKLVSQVDAGRELEPLPDIDFNIRAGNTLVGYATEAQFDASGSLASDLDQRAEIKASTADLADAFDFFRQQQTVHGGKVTADDKRKLRDKLSGLSLELDKYLAMEYGVDPAKPRIFATWRASHQPFHWFAEFYGVMREGGFDVVIGNPPYVEYSQVKTTYAVSQFSDLGNLHAMATARCFQLMTKKAAFAMIVPVALPSTDRFEDLRNKLTKDASLWVSHFDFRPSKLFEGANQRLTIFVRHGCAKEACFTTRYNRWYKEARATLFASLVFTEWDAKGKFCRNVWPKVATKECSAVLSKILKSDIPIAGLCRSGDKSIFYKNTGMLYYTTFTREAPMCFINGKPESSSRETKLRIPDVKHQAILHTLLNSSVFYLMYLIHSNCRDLNPSDISTFKIPSSVMLDARLIAMSDELHSDQQKNSHFIVRNQRLTGEVRIQSFDPSSSKPIIDRIDLILAEHYQMANEETDFIINYDIKYRMGGTDEEE
jgi:hypothetical protein